MFGITLWVLVMILQELMSIAKPSFNIFDPSEFSSEK
jgi:hypothetical protein